MKAPANDWNGPLREAADEIFARYSERLARLARQHLSNRLAARLDEQDVVQSALRTFFRRSERGEFHIDTSSQLWRLLARITIVKAREQGRFHTAGVRDVAAEAGQQSAEPPPLAAPEPGPDDQVTLCDQIESLLAGLPEAYGQLLRCRLEGAQVSTIATDMGLSRQSVYRMLAVLARRFVGQHPEAGSDASL
jgi:hypothetical protein